jgi:hypothetical protein
MVEISMLRSLFRAFLSQTNQRAATAPATAKCIDDSQLKLVAGGLPRGGWPVSESQGACLLPRGGW